MTTEYFTNYPDFAESIPDRRRGVNEQTVEWIEHEHIAIGLEVEAQKLISEAGSPELAKLAIDTVAADTWVEDGESRHERFARQWGFVSYISMVECSMPLQASNEKHWRTTAVRDGRWILWNEAELVAIESFRPLDESEG